MLFLFPFATFIIIIITIIIIFIVIIIIIIIIIEDFNSIDNLFDFKSHHSTCMNIKDLYEIDLDVKLFGVSQQVMAT